MFIHIYIYILILFSPNAIKRHHLQIIMTENIMRHIKIGTIWTSDSLTFLPRNKGILPRFQMKFQTKHSSLIKYLKFICEMILTNIKSWPIKFSNNASFWRLTLHTATHIPYACRLPMTDIYLFFLFPSSASHLMLPKRFPYQNPGGFPNFPQPRNILILLFTVVPCILMLSKSFIYQLMHNRVALKEY